MGLSVRIFGLSSWSVLVPQALMGVAAVAILSATVRRTLGPWPGLLAGLLLAVTPVAAVLFRYDNPDALMTLLLVAAAWATLRAAEEGRTRWVVLAGTLVGLAFLTKSLQAFLVLPALAAVVLLAAPGTLRRRFGQLLAGGAALVVAGGWWFIAVAAIPRNHRPWVGGTSTDSPLDLALGYNGLGRLTGEKSPSGRLLVHGGSVWRLLGSAADQVGWLLPAAGIALVAAAALRLRAGRGDPVRAALLLWGGWAVVTAIVLSLMQGIWHSYYTVELAPALAALVAIGATLLWRHHSRSARAALLAGSAVTTVWAIALVGRRLSLVNPIAAAVLATGLLAVVVLAVPRSRGRRVAGGLLVAAAVLGPASWSLASTRNPHTGSSVVAGPQARTHLPAVSASPAALSLIRDDTDDWTWAAAVVGNRAGGLQLAVGAPVLPVGGFAGSDPAPTLAAFEDDVSDHRVHWYVTGAHGSGPAAQINAWVRQHAHAVRVGGTTLYDLSGLSEPEKDPG
jgi:4-amino-4-deoxy-L-arabinose transferase-like glycosyltransferase